jgi:hypothetical protein
VKAGAVVLFLFAGNVGIKPATTPLYRSFGFRPTLLWTCAGLALTIVAAGFLTASTSLALIALVVLAGGVARSIGLTGFNTIAFTEVPLPGVSEPGAAYTVVFFLIALVLRSRV